MSEEKPCSLITSAFNWLFSFGREGGIKASISTRPGVNLTWVKMLVNVSLVPLQLSCWTMFLQVALPASIVSFFMFWLELGFNYTRIHVKENYLCSLSCITCETLLFIHYILKISHLHKLPSLAGCVLCNPWPWFLICYYVFTFSFGCGHRSCLHL